MDSWDHLYRSDDTPEPGPEPAPDPESEPAPDPESDPDPESESESAPSAPSGPGRAATRRAHRKRNRRRKVYLPIGVGVSLVLLTGISAAYVAYQRLNGNIKTDAVDGKLNADRPEAGGDGTGKPMNLLVIGSDSRAGGNRALGGGGDIGERSDTMLFVHLTSDRKRAVVMSIPRDLLVDIPSCVTKDGTRSEVRRRVMFNSAFEIGGAACTRNTVEKVTDMRVDHHIIVDFAGFKGMVDAVGGVEICLPDNVQDRQGHISLSAGRRKVEGKEALDYVRFRHDNAVGGDGSDLGRIRRQQAFMASLARQIRSGDTLTSPTKLFGLADALTKSIRADEGLDSVRALVELAHGLRNLDTKDITFAHIPVYNPPDDTNRVALVQPDARRLFEAINHDDPLDGSRKPAEDPTTPAVPSIPPVKKAGAKPARPTGSPPAEPPGPPIKPVTRDANQDVCKAN